MKLKELREEKKVSQTALGNYLGVTRSTICQYEKGNRQPDLQTLKKLSNFFEVSVDYLIGNTDVPFKPLEWTEEEKALGVGNHAVKLSEDEWEIIELFSELNRVCGKDTVKAVKTMINALIEQKNKD